ncbi:hypothetical protein H4V99_001929 [Cryobacterium sp. CG_9.6]|nr:hypothetical protein [Cryobacterium sp. CG_9.6]
MVQTARFGVPLSDRGRYYGENRVGWDPTRKSTANDTSRRRYPTIVGAATAGKSATALDERGPAHGPDMKEWKNYVTESPSGA